MIKAGILSDTHLTRITPEFLHAVQQCFAECDVIIHGGDIIDAAVLESFPGKTVYAVHGNCCHSATRTALPEQQRFSLAGFNFGLTHGNQLGADIESGLIALFPEADCLIYGHTHRAVCHRVAGRLVVNPGAFQTTGRYGAPCTYALLEIGKSLMGRIYEFPARSCT
jgi:putative phosphoesterase